MKKWVFGLGCVVVWGSQAWADRDYRSGYGSGYSGFDEMGHVLTVGGGVSSPSMTASLGENPAGLIYNRETKFLGALAGGNSNFNPVGLEALVFLGNGFVGGGLGLKTFNGQSASEGNLTLFNFGIAALVDSLNVSFGATGTYTINQTGVAYGTGAGSTYTGDLGLIYNPNGQTRFGVTAYQFLSGVQAMGLGLSGDPNDWATFTLDASFNPAGGFQSKILKPGMGIHLSDFQFTIGYGIALDSVGNTYLRSGTSFSLGVRLSPNFHLQAHYNDLAQYYVGLTVRI